MGTNRDAVNAKSKWHVEKIIENVYENVLENAYKSEQGKKTYLLDIINELTTILLKHDNTP